MIDVVVSASDKYLWALRPFAYLFNYYWSPTQTVLILGYQHPDFDLPRNFGFVSLADEQYPKEKWGDALLDFLKATKVSNKFVLLLEDYWLCRRVDVNAVDVLVDLMHRQPNILRIDLTADRLYAAGLKDVGCIDRYDLITAPGSQYQLSLQAGIWDKNLLTEVIRKLPEGHRSAWEVETVGTGYVNEQAERMEVVGTRQCPMRYCNALNNAAQDVVNVAWLNDEHLSVIRPWLPADKQMKQVDWAFYQETK